MNTDNKTQSLAVSALMAAMIFVTTFMTKIPVMNGYVHLGDAMIFTALLIIGRNRAALAAGVGAALSDLLGGYGMFAIPTFCCKALMVLVAGLCIEKRIFRLKGRALWIVSSIIGGIVEVAGYFGVTMVLYGWAGASVELVGDIIQITVNIAVAFALCEMLQKSPLKSQLAYTTSGGVNKN